MTKKILLKACITTTFSLSYILFSKVTFAEVGKSITSWKDILIGKTTEEEIIAGNPEGVVNLSAMDLLEFTKRKNMFRVINYGSERSYAEEKRKENEQIAQEREIAQSNKDLLKAFESLRSELKSEPKTEECFKPALLRNGPIDLRWNKLGRAKLEISSTGVILGWVMRYWFYDPADAESFHTAFKEKRYPDKKEILEIFEAELGKPQKILKPESTADEYIFSFDKRKLTLKLSYRLDNKVVFLEFKEGFTPEDFYRTWLALINGVKTDDRSKREKEITDFSRRHEDFEQVRPIMYELSLDPKNKDLSLQELYDMAKKQTKE